LGHEWIPVHDRLDGRAVVGAENEQAAAGVTRPPGSGGNEPAVVDEPAQMFEMQGTRCVLQRHVLNGDAVSRHEKTSRKLPL